VEASVIINLGTTIINGENGVPQVAPVGLNLAKEPYDKEGFAGVFLGSKGAGKSSFASLVAEQTFKHKIPFIFADRGSDTFSLRDLGPSVVTFGSTANVSELRVANRDIDCLHDRNYSYKVARSVIEKGYSLVIDCSVQMRHDADGDINKDGYVNHPLAAFTVFVEALYSVGQQLRRPCMLIVDEASYFAPQKRSARVQKLSCDALQTLSHDSRKSGIATLLLTQRSASINKNVIFDANVKIYGRHSHMQDYKAIKEYDPELEYNQLAGLKTGEVYLISPRGTIKIMLNRCKTNTLGDTPRFESQLDILPDGSSFAKLETSVRSPGDLASDWERV
jgi:DNA helicase HerA-like ATPase